MSEGSDPSTPHFHTDYVISVQLKGTETVRMGEREFTLNARDILLLNPGQVHATAPATEAEKAERRYLSLHIDPARVAEICGRLDAPTSSPAFTRIRLTDSPALARRLTDLLELSRCSTPPSAALDRLLEDVLSEVLERASNVRNPMLHSTDRVRHRKIARAVAHLRGLSAPELASIDLDALAGVAGLSKFHFARAFNELVGMTPGAYVRTLRLCRAARELRGSRTPIRNIARRAGFSGNPSFSRAFARHMGMSPREYQRLGPL